MLPFDVDWRSFALGVVAVAIPAFIVFLINWANTGVNSPFRPQMVVQTTKKTPMQVVMGCAGSSLIIVGVGVLIAVGIIIFVLNGTLPEVWWLVVVAVVSFVAGVVTRALLG